MEKELLRRDSLAQGDLSLLSVAFNLRANTSLLKGIMGNINCSSSLMGHEKLKDPDDGYSEKEVAQNSFSFQARSGWKAFGWRNLKCRRANEASSDNIVAECGLTFGAGSSTSVSSESHGSRTMPALKNVAGPLHYTTPIAIKEFQTIYRKKSKQVVSAAKECYPVKLPSPRSAPPRSELYTEPLLAMEDATPPMDQSFDAMLPSGVVWAEISRGSKIACVTFSHPPGLDSGDVYMPLLLAIGTEDGRVAVMEVLRNAPHYIYGSKQCGTVKDLSRQGKIRSLHFSGQLLAIGGDDCMACLVRVHFRSNGEKGRILDRLEVATELQRVDCVYCVKFSPDGKFLAVGGSDGVLAIASIVSTSKGHILLEIVTEIHQSGLIFCIDWSPDGLFLAVGGNYKSCAIIDKYWKVIDEIQRQAPVNTVQWSPNGTFIAVGCSDGTVTAINIASQSIIGEITRGTPTRMTIDSEFGSANLLEPSNTDRNTAQYNRVNSVCWSPDSNFIAIGATDDTCAIVETHGFSIVHVIYRVGSVNCVDWRHLVCASGEGGCFLALGGDDKNVAILKTGGYEEKSISASEDSFDDASLSDSSSCTDLTGALQHEWILKEDFIDNDESRTERAHFKLSYEEEEPCSNVAIIAVAFSRPNNSGGSTHIAIARGDGNVSVFSTENWHIITNMQFSQVIRTLQFSKKNQFLALGGDHTVVYIITVASWRLYKEIPIGSKIHTLCFSRSDKMLAIVSSDGLLTFVEPTDGWSVVGEIESTAAILTIDWSKNYLAIGRADGRVMLHEARKIYHNVYAHQTTLLRKKPVYSVAFGKGKYLAVAGGDKNIAIYTSKGGWVLCHEMQVNSKISEVKWNSNAQYLAYIGETQTKGATIVDTISWSKIDEHSGEESLRMGAGEDIACLQWSRDGKWVLIAGSSGTAKVIDIETWKLVYSLCTSSKIARGGTASQAPLRSGLIEHENELRDIYKVEGMIDWRSKDIVVDFLYTATVFLSVCEQADRPTPFTIYKPSILMLEAHVTWVSEAKHDTSNSVEIIDDGLPLLQIFRILRIALKIMTELLENENTIGELWKSTAKFALSQKELYQLDAWNRQWLVENANAPIVHILLLKLADQIE